MNLGFFTMPIHPLEKDWRLSLREDREAFILADELGYTEGYVGEHHTDRAENITSCMMFVCTLIEATKRRTPVTVTLSMPSTHSNKNDALRRFDQRADRKSTRLNFRHSQTSYSIFRLKKII